MSMPASTLSALLMGPPGCGKGTQAGRLSRALGVPAISTGEILRQAVADGSELGREVEGVVAAGALVNDELMARVVEERLSRSGTEPGFLLAGYPRTSAQATKLVELLSAASRELEAVVLFEVPEGVLLRRALERRRKDDREDVVRERFRIYHEQTEPLVAHYEGRGLLARVDGDQPIEAVTRAALAAIERG